MTTLIEYKERAYCSSCDLYSWTDTGKDVVCKCGTVMIHNDVRIAGEAVTDEDAFATQAAADLNLTTDDITVNAL